MRETHKEVMRDRTRGNDSFERNSYRLSFGNAYDDRYAARPFFFGED